MNLLLQLLLVATLCAGMYCSKKVESKEVSEPEILESSFYGLEDTEQPEVDDTEENLTPTTPSPRRGRGGRGKGHSGGRRHKHKGQHAQMWSNKDATDEQKLDHICGALLSDKSHDHHTKYFMKKMERMDPAVKEQFITAMTSRKTHMLKCCKLEESDREQCVTEYHKERYNRVCKNEEPLCVWALMKGTTDQSSATVDKCCALQDEERVDCFVSARAAYKQNKWQKKKHFIV